jgi:hypothetical protein
VIPAPSALATVAALALAGAVQGPATPAREGPPDGSISSSAFPDSVHPGSGLRVYLVTIGPGDLVWEKFGHNAIRIVDTADGTDVSWNWGMFDFAQENFWPRLIKGEMLYGMVGYLTDRTLAEFAYYDRPVWYQQLDLSPDQK